MTIADEIERLRRFPQDAEVSLTLGIVKTKESYGGQFLFTIFDTVLPDWSKPDSDEEYRRIMEDDEGECSESDVADIAAALNRSAAVAELLEALRESAKELKDIIDWHRDEDTPLRDIELRHIRGVRERAAEVLAKWGKDSE